MRNACLLAFLTWLAAAQEMPNWVVPSFTDLTLKTRQTHGLMMAQDQTFYFKGTRERIVHGPAQTRPGYVPFLVTLMQCDARTIVRLRPHTKTYTTSVKPEIPDREGKQRPIQVPPADGPVVTVTISSVDTGETRQVGSYQARHLKTTVLIKPSKGAAAKPGKVEADSWYLDIPGQGCRSEDTRPREWARLYVQLLAHQFSDHPDHVEIKASGAQARGLVIEEIAQAISDGNEMVFKTELVEASSEPLDQSLFEIPPDYTPVPPGLQGNLR